MTSYRYEYSTIETPAHLTSRKEPCEACRKLFVAGDAVHHFKPSNRFLCYRGLCDSCAAKDATFKPREILRFDEAKAMWRAEPIATS